MKTLCIIQARIGSTRLPRKVLEEIDGKPLIGRVIERVQRSRVVDEVVLATSEREEDGVLAEVAEAAGVQFFRGSEDDVLDRFVRAMRRFGGDVVLRVTGDCPLLEPAIIDEVVALYREAPADYIFIQNYPRGVGDVELMRPEALEKAWSLTGPGDRYYREHVMTFLVDNPGMFRVRVEEAPEPFRRPELRVCVDEADDLRLVREIYGHFAPRRNFSLEELIAYLDAHPGVVGINVRVRQREAVVARPRIVFRVDGGPEIGMGHVVRCGALAAEFRRLKDCEVHWVTKSACLLEREVGIACAIHEIPDGCSGSEARDFFLSHVRSADAVIVDLPRADACCLEVLSGYSGLRVHLSDENDFELPADVVVNPSLCADGSQSSTADGVYIGGRDAVILRDQFRSFAERQRVIGGRVEEVLVCFGGGDPGGITVRVLQILRGLDAEWLQVLVVLGSANPDRRKVEVTAGVLPGLQVVSSLGDMAGALWRSDLALISGGTLMYEACALGTPCIVISQNAAQDREARLFAGHQAVVNLGEHCVISDRTIGETVAIMMSDAERRRHLSRNARKLVDPLGARRVAMRILDEIGKRRR